MPPLIKSVDAKCMESFRCHISSSSSSSSYQREKSHMIFFRRSNDGRSRLRLCLKWLWLCHFCAFIFFFMSSTSCFYGNRLCFGGLTSLPKTMTCFIFFNLSSTCFSLHSVLQNGNKWVLHFSQYIFGGRERNVTGNRRWWVPGCTNERLDSSYNTNRSFKICD